MLKRKYNEKNISKKNQRTTISTNDFDDKENSVANATINSSNENEKDIFDKTKEVMKKRKKHLQDFYHGAKRTKVLSDVDVDDDDTLDESTENLTQETSKNDSSNNTKLQEIDSSCSNGAGVCLSSNLPLTTSSCRPPLISTPNNTERRPELNKSILLHKKKQSDQYLTNKRSSGMIHDDDNRDRSMSSSQQRDESRVEASQQIDNTSVSIKKSSKIQPASNQNSSILSQTTFNTAAPHVSKSTITFVTPTTNNRHVNSNFSQSSNNFNVDRSLICSSDSNSQLTVNRTSTNTSSQWRSVDIRNSMEYRELNKKNTDLSNKIENLKEALSKERKERKKMNETHILKPRPSFLNEISLFMQTHGNTYQGDGRALDEIARELGLTDQMIEAVQRDASKPDKIAMNIWRKLCPTVEDKVLVGSIKNVPVSTLDNIYVFSRLCRPRTSLDYKKMRSDIAANIRQGNLAYRAHETMLMDQDVVQQNDDNDDEDDEDDVDREDGEDGKDGEDDEDEANETNDIVNDFEVHVPTRTVVDDSSSDEEE